MARRMYSDGEWRGKFVRLSEDIRTYRHVLDRTGSDFDTSVEPELRELLVWAWCVLISAPESYAQFYLRLPEVGEESLESLALALRQRDFEIDGLDTAQRKRIEWLGALVRVIDEELCGFDGLPEGTIGWSPDQWKPDGYPCYVIPVDRRFRAEDYKDRARRGMLWHAVVPSELASLAVELVILPDLSEQGHSRQWRYGSALFDGLTIDVVPSGPRGFLVADAPVQAAEARISAHIDCALADCCDVLVWPELTVPHARLVTLQERLASEPLRDPRRIRISVAGSRHMHIGDGTWINRTEVFAGKGQRIAAYDKRRPFPLGDRVEEIEPGKKLLVLVAEDRLVAIAICRDFCDDIDRGIYEMLGVDMVLVPSMGRRSTIDAHKRAAKSMQSNHGCITVVVQQLNVPTGEQVPADEPLGYSFASPRDSVARTPDYSQKTHFRTLTGRR